MADQDGFFSELQEDYKRDQWRRLWDNYGNMVIATCVAIVIGTGIGVAWRDYQLGQNRLFTGELIKAVSIKDDEVKHKTLAELAKKADGRAVAAAARLHLAALEIESDQQKDALEEYKAVSDGKADQGLRSLARVLANYTAADQGVDLFANEAVKPGSALYDNWKEAEGWHAYATGKQNDALARFGALKDDADVAKPIRQRMQIVSAFLAPQTKEAVEEKPSEESAE